MSTNFDLTYSQLKDKNSELSTSIVHSQEFSYIKDSNDLTDYALDFQNDELSYYHTIKSYTSDENMALFICVNGLISAGAYYTSDGIINEYFRNNEPSEKKFTSVKDWYNDYYGEVVTIDKLLNNVFIGEDLVPLWRVLLDEKESNDYENEDDENFGKHMNEYMTLFTVYTSLTVLFISIFGLIILSFV